MFSVTLSILLVLPTRRCQATNWTATMAEAANKTIWEAARLPVLFMTEIFFFVWGHFIFIVPVPGHSLSVDVLHFFATEALRRRGTFDWFGRRWRRRLRRGRRWSRMSDFR